MALTEQGYHRPTYDEILSAKIQKANELFGADIDTSEQTPLGKFIRINAYDLSKAYEDLEMTYYARFPNTAFGISLDRLCVFAGITRNPSTHAQHKIKVFGQPETAIGIGELVVSSENDVTFYSINNYEIPEGGSVDVIVECTEAGEIGNVSAITEIVNPIAEIDHIEYVGIEQPGEEAESDINLRKRFSAAIEGAGSSNVNAIRAALMRIPTVVSAGVIENDTDETDSKGRPPRSFECFVYGGEGYEQQIAEAIFEKSPIGIKTCSTSTSPITKTVYDDGGYEHTIQFSHTDNVTVYLKITIKKNNNFESDGEAQIKNAIISYINNLGVGEDVILSSLYGIIHSVTGVIEVTLLQSSTNGTSYTGDNITIEDWQVANITVNEINLVVSS